MKVIAAYLLAVLAGNKNPDVASLTKILSSVGIEADKQKVEKLIAELKGKDITEVIAAGSAKLTSMPSIGGGGGGGGGDSGTAVSKGDAPKEEKGKEAAKGKEKKEEKKVEKEEEDEDMGFGLFD